MCIFSTSKKKKLFNFFVVVVELKITLCSIKKKQNQSQFNILNKRLKKN